MFDIDFRKKASGGGVFSLAKKANQYLPHIELCSNLCDLIGKLEKKSKITHYRFEQDESLKKSLTHSENAIKSL